MAPICAGRPLNLNREKYLRLVALTTARTVGATLVATEVAPTVLLFSINRSCSAVSGAEYFGVVPEVVFNKRRNKIVAVVVAIVHP